MYIYIYTYIHIYIYAYIYIYIYIHIHIYIHIYIYAHVSICICELYMYMHICICVCICVCACVRVYICICMHTYTSTSLLLTSRSPAALLHHRGRMQSNPADALSTSQGPYGTNAAVPVGSSLSITGMVLRAPPSKPPCLGGVRVERRCSKASTATVETGGTFQME